MNLRVALWPVQKLAQESYAIFWRKINAAATFNENQRIILVASDFDEQTKVTNKPSFDFIYLCHIVSIIVPLWVCKLIIERG